MRKEGLIGHVPGAGYTVATDRRPVFQELRLENLLLVTEVREPHIAQARSSVGVTPAHGVNKAFPGEPEWFEHFFDTWRVRFQIFKNGTITAILSASGGVGLAYIDFNRFVGWLEGLYPTIPIARWEARNWEWHRDFPGFKIEGAKAVTLQAFENVWFKLYNKAQGLRLEMRQSTAIPLHTALELMAKYAEEFAKYGVVVVREVRT
jgi:hypothetical protein